jgi:ubiquitin carboxyl-terminal hydrolase 9/24
MFLCRLCKLMFTTAGYSLVHMVAEACQPDAVISVSPVVHKQAVVLQQAMLNIPNPNQELVLRNLAQRLATSLLEQGAYNLPEMATVQALMRLAWASAAGSLGLLNSSSLEETHQKMQSGSAPESDEEVDICQKALEVLALAVALYPTSLDPLSKDKLWHKFIVDLVLVSKVRAIRHCAADQFGLIATTCSDQHHPVRFFTTLLFTMLDNQVPQVSAKVSYNAKCVK